MRGRTFGWLKSWLMDYFKSLPSSYALKDALKEQLKHGSISTESERGSLMIHMFFENLKFLTNVCVGR